MRKRGRRESEREGHEHRMELRRGGIALSLLLVTPSQLPGFMERFLSWCCVLIDIKMH